MILYADGEEKHGKCFQDEYNFFLGKYEMRIRKANRVLHDYKLYFPIPIS